jgi:hypothetical protein
MEYITSQTNPETEIYQTKMLEYFELTSFNEQQLTTCVVKLYNQIKNSSRYKTELHEIMKQKAAKILSEDPVIGFMLFFSFDTYEICYNTIQILLNGNDEEWEEALKIFKEAIL